MQHFLESATAARLAPLSSSPAQLRGPDGAETARAAS